jgi:putative ABC transport system substrate-binding protein
MMERRAFMGVAAAALIGAPLRAFAQPRVPRIGFLYFGSRQSARETGRYDAFVRGMRDLGYVDGKTVGYEFRYGDGSDERLPPLVAELMRAQVDVIVATGTPVYRALRNANNAIPVVVTVTADPVREGIAASVARPGGNFTGLTDTAADLAPKQFEYLRDLVPGLARLGALLNPGNTSHPAQATRLILTAQNRGIQIVLAEAGNAAEIEPAFTSLTELRSQGVLLFGDTFFAQQYAQIAQAALKRRMSSIGLTRDYARAGGLMSYGPDVTENFRRAAGYVDRILKGAKAADLAFEQPTTYHLVVNVNTARALGLAPPQPLLLRADEIVQ